MSGRMDLPSRKTHSKDQLSLQIHLLVIKVSTPQAYIHSCTMTSNAADASKVDAPRLHHIDTSSTGGTSGPFWDSSGRCFWLMGGRQVYTHPENFSGSSACATIASANPGSAYPSGWSSGQRIRSLSGSDRTPESAAHEDKRMRPDYIKSSNTKGPQMTERKSPQIDYANLPPPPPFPPQRSQSVRFSPNFSLPNNSPPQLNTNQSSFPQRSQSVRFTDDRSTRSSGPSPSPNIHRSSLPTRTYQPPTFSPSPTRASSSRLYQPPTTLRDSEHEEEDSSPSSSSSHHSSKYHSRPNRHLSRQESRRQRLHNRRLDYDSDNLSDEENGKTREKRLRSRSRSERGEGRLPSEQKKHEKTLKGIGEVGRGEMGRASFLAALPFVCFLARLAA
ncbi:hypothetical protein CJF32_00000171 [Rutstroemia sp. NJR-2017a WRK4]|nr:hypothetical protein CJF32_00000171 [Rutstroemia sp. NJR-2017a WRK4]